MAKSFLTKSRFKLGCECPTKLFYAAHREYQNTQQDDAFLRALAEGGFQVGELAKMYFAEGHEISTLDAPQAVVETEKLLLKENVVIFEAAFCFESLLVRVDILRKCGNSLELIEVKAKSIGAEAAPFFKKKTRELDRMWEPYLLDVAFQAHVLSRAHPEFKVTPFLMLADSQAVASVDGLNQNFILQHAQGRSQAVKRAGLSPQDLGDKILRQIDVSEEVDFIFEDFRQDGRNFLALVEYLSQVHSGGQKVSSPVGAHCKGCEFRVPSDALKATGKNGFAECWSTQLNLSADDLKKPLAFEIWNFRQTDDLLARGIIFMDQLNPDDLSAKTAKKESKGLSPADRQWLQVKKLKDQDSSEYIDESGLRELFSTLVYPLNFIDFETTMVALPFHRGRKPYEQIAFQFSHHVVDREGRVEHKNEYIHSQRGAFPNFDFVRALKAALSENQGSIFRYAVHENTVLCQIHDQLLASQEIDKVELCTWIQSLTEKKGQWRGARNMIDLCEAVKKYYYHPLMHGSNSIKKVLPALLQSSKFIQARYSAAVYGAQIPSKNFQNWSWIQRDAEGRALDPYKLLPPIFSEEEPSPSELSTDNSLADGGAAMTAYARMQFSEMSEPETQALRQALLKYCELDTLAMVMIYEHWAHRLGWLKKRQAA